MNFYKITGPGAQRNAVAIVQAPDEEQAIRFVVGHIMNECPWALEKDGTWEPESVDLITPGDEGGILYMDVGENKKQEGYNV